MLAKSYSLGCTSNKSKFSDHLLAVGTSSNQSGDLAVSNAPAKPLLSLSSESPSVTMPTNGYSRNKLEKFVLKQILNLIIGIAGHEDLHSSANQVFCHSCDFLHHFILRHTMCLCVYFGLSLSFAHLLCVMIACFNMLLVFACELWLQTCLGKSVVSYKATQRHCHN